MKKSTIVVVFVFTFLFVWGFNCYGEGKPINGCYKKNGGQLRIVNNSKACHHSEIPISWNMVGPQGPQGPAGPVGPAGKAITIEPGPRVYDSEGQYLGVLPGNNEGFLSIYIPSLSRFILLSPDNGDIDPYFPAVYLYFDVNNCAGNSYVDLSMRYQIFKLGSKYYATEEAAGDCVNIKSLSTPELSSQCRGYSASCLQVLQYHEVSLPFTTPVALPLHFEY
jgi:hypothetical protein